MPAPHSNTALQYRPDIDGLRAIAILGVVAYHIGAPWITGGFTGVDVFFVISGYLITQLLVRQIQTTNRLSLVDFYARRIRRLLPALAVVIATALLIGCFVLPPNGERLSLARSALASLGFVANQYFLSSTSGYFDGPSDLKPLLHLWSLSVEEQFYILWPLALIVVTKLQAPADRLRSFRITIGAIALVSFALSLWLVHHDQSMAFFISPGRAWELGVGALLSLWPANRSAATSFLGAAASWTGALFIAAAYTLIEPTSAFPGAAALLPVLGAALLIYGNERAPDSSWARILSTRPMVAIGTVSYGWYLWHWPLLAFARTRRLLAPDLIADTGLVLLALLLAALTLRFVENPIRYGAAARRMTNRRVLAAGAASILALGAAAGGVLLLQQFGSHSEREILSLRAARDWPTFAIQKCLLERQATAAAIAADTCRFGDPDQPIRMVLWGDSHAMSWAPLLQALQTEGRPAFLLRSMSSCQPLLPPDVSSATLCNEFNRVTLQKIAELESRGLATVVLSGRWVTLNRPSISRYDTPLDRSGLRQLIRDLRARRRTGADEGAPKPIPLAAGLQGTLSQLQALGLRVIVLIDPPEFRQPVPDCIYAHFDAPGLCGMSRNDYESYTGDTVATILRTAAAFANVRVINPVEHFCNQSDCPAFVNEMPTLFDDDHISASAARSLAPALQAQFEWALGGSLSSR